MKTSMRCLFIAIIVIAVASQIRTVVAQPVRDETPDIEGMQQELDEIREAKEALWEEAQRGELSEAEYEERGDRLLGRLMGLMMRADRGTFLFEGEVVDEHGQRLDGVDLAVVKRVDTGIESSRSKTEKHEINGSFSVSARGYTAVALIFTKPGYYQAHLRFPQLTMEEQAALSREFDRGRIRPKHYEHRSMRVELHSIGEVADVHRIGYQLRFQSASEPATSSVQSFLDIVSPDRRFPPTRTVPHIPDDMPLGALYVDPALDYSEQLILHDEIARPFPKAVTLVLNDPEGGLILWENGGPEEGFWFMDEAPEEGYEQRVRIDGQMLKDRFIHPPNPHATGIYFYLKVGGIYGKGKLRNLVVYQEGRELVSSFELLFQLDGSRFLRSDRHYR